MKPSSYTPCSCYALLFILHLLPHPITTSVDAPAGDKPFTGHRWFTGCRSHGASQPCLAALCSLKPSTCCSLPPRSLLLPVIWCWELLCVHQLFRHLGSAFLSRLLSSPLCPPSNFSFTPGVTQVPSIFPQLPVSVNN